LSLPPSHNSRYCDLCFVHSDAALSYAVAMPNLLLIVTLADYRTVSSVWPVEAKILVCVADTDRPNVWNSWYICD
jgi:hypothetical protein